MVPIFRPIIYDASSPERSRTSNVICNPAPRTLCSIAALIPSLRAAGRQLLPCYPATGLSRKPGIGAFGMPGPPEVECNFVEHLRLLPANTLRKPTELSA